MVENQHSINSILSFGAKSVNPEILEKLLVGREDTVKRLYKAVETIALHQQSQFILTIAQRGMGKTHLIRVLYHRIQPFINDNKIVVAYFSEEEYGVANYFDFLLRIINSLMKWNEEDKEKLQNEINKLIETPKNNRENFAEKIIEEYLDKKPLLILAENFADILEDIKQKEQGKLRAWLYRTNYVSIIATSQAISRDFEREDRPFYGFFTTSYLKKLSYQNSVDFLILLAEIDKKEDVIEFIKNKGAGQIKALHTLVKGNHRLLVTFYQFLKTNTLVDLSVNFIKTINDLKPYYETYIRNLPAQQQKVLRYIALNHKPIQGIEISRNCFIDQNTLTKQLSELIKKKLVEAIPNPNNKRNKLYDIDEPLLRISIEVGEHKEGITAIFIDFLAIYYNEKELSSKKENFIKLLNTCKTEQERLKISYEIGALDRAIILKKTDYAYLESDKDIQEVIKKYLENNDDANLFEYLKEEKLIIDLEEYYDEYAQYFFERDKYKKAILLLKKLVKMNLNNTNAQSNLARAYYNYGYGLFNVAKIKQDENMFLESIEMFKNAIKVNPNLAEAYNNFGNSIFSLGILKLDENLINQSIEKYKKAIELNRNFADPYSNWGAALNFSAAMKQDEKLFKESIKKHKEAIKINPNYAEAHHNYAISIANLAILTKDKTLFNDFLNKLYKAIELNPKNKLHYGLLLEGIKSIPKIKNISLKEIIEIINTISKNNLSDLLNEWILYTLSNYKNITETQLNTLSKIAQKHKIQNKELIIIENYIAIYQRYVLEEDKKAIYDLPKEQRLFFEEHILKLLKD